MVMVIFGRLGAAGAYLSQYRTRSETGSIRTVALAEVWDSYGMPHFGTESA